MHHEPSFRPLSRSIPLFAVIGLLLVSPIATPSLQAQDENAVLQVFALERMNATNAESIITTVYGDDLMRIQADPDQNRLIVLASKASLAKVAETLQTLDQPAPVQESKSVVFYIAHVPAEDLLQSMNMILKAHPLDGVNMVANKRTNSIIVSAPTAESLSFIESKIELIDQPLPDDAADKQPGPCEIRVTWLIETKDLDDDDKASTRPIPKSLEKLGNHLIQRHGFQELRTLTSLASTVSPGQDLGPASFTGNSHKQGVTEAELQVGGEIQLATDDSGRFEIHYRAKMTLTDYGSESSPESSLIIPANHPVAISVADTAPYRSVLVLEIEELE